MNRLLTLALALGFAGVAHASILWDNTGSPTAFTIRTAGGNMPAGHWTNTNAFSITLGEVAFLGDLGVDSNIKYVLANGAGVVVDSVVVAHTDAGLGLYAATVNWTIGAGESFYIASMNETGTTTYSYRTPVGTLQNGILGLNNGNFANYSNPTSVGDAGAEMSWRLSDAAPVPEPFTMVLAAAGLAAAARRRRRA